MENHELVFGIDIIRGSVRSKTRRPVYALIQMLEGVIIEESQVSLFRLIRLVTSKKPRILALDSLQEISTDKKELFGFLQSLPTSTRLVQVTGGEQLESLGKIAARYNIRFNKFNPFEEARTIAHLASLGAGYEVIAFENETTILVSRHRSPGKGGWSQNRYTRKIHGAVLQQSREIEMAIIAAGLRYKKREVKAFGGCRRVIFDVAALREAIPVNNTRKADVQVKIEGKRLDRVQFRPVKAKPKYLIVGVDPGTTTAFAALDLDGNLVLLHSSRMTSLAGVIESLYKVGKPLIIASDVQTMPYSVEKIRRAFNAVGYSPRQEISIPVKFELTSGFSYKNDHERDALSAAVNAFRHYRQKFQNLLRRVPPGHDLLEVKAGVVKGIPLEQILHSTPEKRGTETGLDISPPAAPTEKDEKVRVLDGIVKQLRGFIEDLKQESRVREYEVTRLQARLRKVNRERDTKIKRDSEIIKRDSAIQGLKDRLKEKDKEIRRLQKKLKYIYESDTLSSSDDKEPVKFLSNLNHESLKEISIKSPVMEGDILYVHDKTGWGRNSFRELTNWKVRALIISKTDDTSIPVSLLELAHEHRIPLLEAGDLNYTKKGQVGSVNRNRLKEELHEWERKQAEFDRTKKNEMMEHLFKEYQAERGKEVKKTG